jgi:hypothetical protein
MGKALKVIGIIILTPIVFVWMLLSYLVKHTP